MRFGGIKSYCMTSRGISCEFNINVTIVQKTLHNNKTYSYILRLHKKIFLGIDHRPSVTSFTSNKALTCT